VLADVKTLVVSGGRREDGNSHIRARSAIEGTARQLSRVSSHRGRHTGRSLERIADRAHAASRRHHSRLAAGKRAGCDILCELAESKQVTVLFADVVHSMDIAAAVGAAARDHGRAG